LKEAGGEEREEKRSRERERLTTKERRKKKMKFTVKIVEGRNLLAADFNGLSDPYCVVTIFGEEFKTKVKKKTLNPTWDEAFVHLTHGIPKEDDNVTVLVYDYDLIGKHNFLGQVKIPSSDLKAPSDKWYTLEPGKNKKKVKGDIRIVIEVQHVDDENSGLFCFVLLCFLFFSSFSVLTRTSFR